MAKNSNLNRAKDAKQDEFYTRREDIENELPHYAEHFKGKVVYCNCDDPVESEFWQFFMRNFKSWGLKKLIATHYEHDEKNYSYVLEICEDTNGDGVVNYLDEPTMTQIPCNGDFRSGVCIEYLKEADIVVTNPPFSLFREYMAQLMEYDKKFVIVGTINAVKYKEIFPLIMHDKIWTGFKPFSGGMDMIVPAKIFDPTKVKKYYIDSDGKAIVNIQGVCWFTNLDISKRHQILDLRGNYYSPEKYPKYDNFDGIDVSKVADIPCDYAGNIGVPITFLSDYSPDQFEIIGMGTGDTAKAIGVTKNYRGRTDLAFTDSNGKQKCPYTRIVIRNKHPEERRYED